MTSYRSRIIIRGLKLPRDSISALAILFINTGFNSKETAYHLVSVDSTAVESLKSFAGHCLVTSFAGNLVTTYLD